MWKGILTFIIGVFAGAVLVIYADIDDRKLTYKEQIKAEKEWVEERYQYYINTDGRLKRLVKPDPIKQREKELLKKAWCDLAFAIEDIMMQYEIWK